MNINYKCDIIIKRKQHFKIMLKGVLEMTESVRKIIEDVNATMRLEGMPLTLEDKEIIRKCLEGESTFEAERQKIFQEIRSLNG